MDIPQITKLYTRDIDRPVYCKALNVEIQKNDLIYLTTYLWCKYIIPQKRTKPATSHYKHRTLHKGAGER